MRSTGYYSRIQLSPRRASAQEEALRRRRVWRVCGAWLIVTPIRTLCRAERSTGPSWPIICRSRVIAKYFQRQNFRRAFSNWLGVIKPGAAVYICCRRSHQSRAASTFCLRGVDFLELVFGHITQPSTRSILVHLSFKMWVFRAPLHSPMVFDPENHLSGVG